MKTIFRAKRPQNKYIGFSLLLLIAICGFSIAGVKSATVIPAKSFADCNNTLTVPSTGSQAGAIDNTSSNSFPASFLYNERSAQEITPNLHQSAKLEHSEIGGQRVPGDPAPLGFTARQIGGKSIPKTANARQYPIGGESAPRHEITIGGGQPLPPHS